jgi:RNase P/RNase MRP subunit POP5
MVKRERHRYILFKIILDKNNGFSEQELLKAIWQSIWNLFGLKEASKMGMWLVRMDIDKKYGIMRCSHKTKEYLISALTLIKEISGNRVILSPIKTSGTIRGIKDIIDMKLKT